MSILKAATGKPTRVAAALGVAAAAVVVSFATPASAATVSISPSTGAAASTTSVLTVTGTGFKTAAGATVVGTVYFDSDAACDTFANKGGASQTQVTVKSVVSAKKMVLTTPSLAATPVTNAKKAYQLCVYSSSALISNGAYTVYAVPAITAVLSNTSGPAAGGGSVVVTGTGFTPASVVKFGTTVAPTRTVSADGTTITVTPPAHAAGAVAVSVATEGGTNPTPATGTWDDFTYTNAISVDPLTGVNATATTITVTGVGFTSYDFTAGATNDAVMFVPGSYIKATHGVGGTAAAAQCSNIQVISDTELVCDTPSTVSNTPLTVTIVDDKSAGGVGTPTVVSSSATFTFAAF